MNRNKKEYKRMGATLGFVRTERGVTQAELARELNISQAYVANIESGRRGLSPALARKACEVLGIRPIVLVNEDFLNSDIPKKKTA